MHTISLGVEHARPALEGGVASVPSQAIDADQSEGVSPNVVVELHRTTDLNLHSTKQVARAIDIVTTERHVWLNLLGLKEQERYFLLDAPLSPSGLFGKSSKSSGRRNVMWQWHLKSTSPIAVSVLQSPLLIL